MAVNDKDPTEAIQLVEQTIGTFHQIVVGQEGQMVPVPGYPDQPTLAERVKQNLKPSTDAAAGYAAQAREEATKAAREADRASQIAGLDTVAEAVGLAAIPFPDVWIPLSDSLRMLAGYGREVKVGDDVVANYATLTRNSAATMVNKSLSLAPAAINEARFERDGVLTEDKSTNVLPISTPFIGDRFWIKAEKAQWSDEGVGPDGKPCISVKGLDGSSISSNDSSLYGPVGSLGLGVKTHTLSLWIRVLSAASGASIIVRMSGENNWTFATKYPVINIGEWVRISASGLSSISSNLLIGTVGGPIDCDISCIQLEAMPFATSHIPTNGAAVTRAADKLTIPRLNNDCAEWYSGPDQINPIVTADTIELYPPAGKAHLRNVRGFFTPLTPAQKAALK